MYYTNIIYSLYEVVKNLSSECKWSCVQIPSSVIWSQVASLVCMMGIIAPCIALLCEFLNRYREKQASIAPGTKWICVQTYAPLFCSPPCLIGCLPFSITPSCDCQVVLLSTSGCFLNT